MGGLWLSAAKFKVYKTNMLEGPQSDGRETGVQVHA
jgi:hypothetical protein